ncbi:MoaF-related domain-containing protein [Pseudomonas sp. NPDC090202]|uniref:MoaF-related domain-containing protein n=1 Tax=unclassified Pseudomonas TaxID=196821 RepID=UPI0037F4AE61
MTADHALPPFAGQTFEVSYGDLAALNAYDTDGQHLTYTITTGLLTGATGKVRYSWQEIAQGMFAISWQEADGATVVHIDDFTGGTSRSFYTTPTLELYRLEGSLKAVAA